MLFCYRRKRRKSGGKNFEKDGGRLQRKYKNPAVPHFLPAIALPRDRRRGGSGMPGRGSLRDQRGGGGSADGSPGESRPAIAPAGHSILRAPRAAPARQAGEAGPSEPPGPGGLSVERGRCARPAGPVRSGPVRERLKPCCPAKPRALGPASVAVAIRCPRRKPRRHGGFHRLDQAVLRGRPGVRCSPKNVLAGKNPREKTLRKLYWCVNADAKDIESFIAALKHVNKTLVWTDNSKYANSNIRQMINDL